MQLLPSASYYAIRDEQGKSSIVVCHGKPNDPNRLITGLNLARCHQCWTYEWVHSLVTPRVISPFQRVDIIPTLSYDHTRKRITIPHLCLHNISMIRTVLCNAVKSNDCFEVHLNKINFQHLELDNKFINIFEGINIFFDTKINPGDLAMRDFKHFMQLFQFNFLSVTLLNEWSDRKSDSLWGDGFTVENYGTTADVPIVTPEIWKLLLTNPKLEELHITVFDTSDFPDYWVQPLCKLKTLIIVDIDPTNNLDDSDVEHVTELLWRFKESLEYLAIGDHDSHWIIDQLFVARDCWPRLRTIKTYFSVEDNDDKNFAPRNRYNFPVLTTVNFIDENIVYSPNPPMINRTTMEIYQPRCEELYSMLMRNRRNFVAAKVWEVIATNYVGKRYKISPDIRRMISHLITHVDTRLVGQVEVEISSSWRDILPIKTISSGDIVGDDVVYCVDAESRARWRKIDKIQGNLEEHDERKAELLSRIDHDEKEIAGADQKKELKLLAYQKRLEKATKLKVKNLKSSVDKKRKRLESLAVEDSELEANLKRIIRE